MDFSWTIILCLNCDPNKLLFLATLQYFALPNESLDLALITVAIDSIWTSFGC